MRIREMMENITRASFNGTTPVNGGLGFHSTKGKIKIEKPLSPKKKLETAIGKLKAQPDLYRNIFREKETLAFQQKLREMYSDFLGEFEAEREYVGSYDAYRRLSDCTRNMSFANAERLNTVSGELLQTVTSQKGNPEEWISAGYLRTVCTLLRDVYKMGMWMNTAEHDYASALELFGKAVPQRDALGKKCQPNSRKARILAKNSELGTLGMEFAELVLRTGSPATLFEAD